MIQYWRRIWRLRTDLITDPEFPFGFVQVRKSFSIFLFENLRLYSYQPESQLETSSVDFLGFDGIKLLT
jgi:hypothetical protein